MGSIFDQRAQEYDAWFDERPFVYRSELDALQGAVNGRTGLEVGVGTGRFAHHMGIGYGIDPSAPMLSIARSRGIETVRGRAEHLPFRDGSFDLVLFVTTLCFLDEPPRAMAEAARVVRPGGRIVIGFIDRSSPPGRAYVASLRDSPFYEGARFHTAQEVEGSLRRTGRGAIDSHQTIFGEPREMTAPHPVIEGHGRGLFVVMSIEIGQDGQ